MEGVMGHYTVLQAIKTDNCCLCLLRMPKLQECYCKLVSFGSGHMDFSYIELMELAQLHQLRFVDVIVQGPYEDLQWIWPWHGTKPGSQSWGLLYMKVRSA